MICPNCGTPTGESNPIQRYEYDSAEPRREMCSECVQIWDKRVRRVAKEQLEVLHREFVERKASIMREVAGYVDPARKTAAGGNR